MESLQGLSRDLAIAAAVFGSLVLTVVVVHLMSRPPYYALREKVVLVTGGSSGIGKSIAAAALQKGAHVAIMARQAALLAGATLLDLGHERSYAYRLTNPLQLLDQSF